MPLLQTFVRTAAALLAVLVGLAGATQASAGPQPHGAPEAAEARLAGTEARVGAAGVLLGDTQARLARAESRFRPPQPDALSGLLDSLLESPVLANDQVGFILMDRDGKVRFARNADRRFVPASTRKVLLTAAAWSLLGQGATFSTRVWASGRHDGDRLEGDLILEGGGDPSLDDAGLLDLAQQVASAGIRVVTGDLLGDASLFRPRDEFGLGWPLDDEPFAYASRVSALVANRNAATGSVEMAASLRPAVYSLERFVAAAAWAGLDVRGAAVMGQVPAGARLVAQRWSPPLADLLAWTNKRSDNLYAETLLRHLGTVAPVDTSTPSVSLGLDAEAAWLGWPRDAFRLVDGSGLSRYDLLTPRQVADVLLRMKDQPSFLATLPVSGQDGTLAERMTGTPAEGKVRAKTGSMSGIACLAGYAGEKWIFAFMVNGHVGSLAPVRAIQDAVCVALMDSTATGSAR